MSVSEINIDSTVQLAADQFEVAINGSQPYRDGVTGASLSTGLLEPLYLEPELITHIGAGIVDDIELRILPDRMLTVVKGRDACALAVDSTVYVTYATNTNLVEAETLPETTAGFPGLPVTPGVTTPEVLAGPWTARRVAEDLCARVGLSCVYQAPDYTLREDVTVSGPILNAIHALVEPFNHFEPSKVDVYADGLTLIVRQRGSAGAGLTMSVHDARITSLSARATKLDKVRVLRVTGSRTGTNVHGGVAVDPGAVETEDSQDTLDPVTGAVAMRVVTKERKRILDGAVLSQKIDTYRRTFAEDGITPVPLHLVSVQETQAEWAALTLRYPNVIVGQPRELYRVVKTSGFDDEGVFGPISRTTISHDYASDGFLLAQNTSEDLWSAANTRWEHSKSQTKQYRRNGPSMYQITVSEFGSDGAPGDVHRTTANGTPPGGPGLRTDRGAGSSSMFEPVVYATVISTDPGAKDVTIQNASLLPEHVAAIAAQAAEASGATEREISCTMVGMPWIRKGQRINLTGLLAEDGVTVIPLDDLLVASARFEYREASESPTYLTFLKLVRWN